jgi:hypothetical protein
MPECPNMTKYPMIQPVCVRVPTLSLDPLALTTTMAFPVSPFEKRYIKTHHHAPYAAIDTAGVLKDSARGLNVLVTFV